ncbi:DUF305 domain-containing protein [Actinotalea ferrariae]|uniref:DUF305 domain-containing protein n=1 Tax=Actinotalea ferrariae TaxID=1386098 RepID=UPI001EB0DD73|nr:DUF305 domain-containing protein [Actinotalea ferrariae]MBX9243841.1 DUF305 domain-containing protein [Actinotalea ferrariae]
MLFGANTSRSAAPDPVPADTSVEAGFARDMQVHHSQAVEMSTIVRDRTEDQTIRTLALDLMLTQQQQAGQMYGWLEQWDLPQASTAAPMEWMAKDGDDMAAMGHGEPSPPPGEDRATVTMPGMATDEDLRLLRELEAQEAEVLYLQLMIAHHQGGVDMAGAALAAADDDDVLRLAHAVVDSQTAEIAVLNELLAERVAAGN